MELPHLGQHCSNQHCNKLDFLPVKCDACLKSFCDEHYGYASHNCQNAYQKNNEVPVCPLCNIPIPVQKGMQPDLIVGRHIDNDCQSDPAKSRRKVFSNKCSFKKCKIKEVIPVVCNECSLNFCLKHRHPTDHSCEGRYVRQNYQNIVPTNISDKFHGTMSEDEALARALALSMQDAKPSVDKRIQEELDMQLARQLQASESRQPIAATGPRQSSRDRCNVS